MFDDFFIVQAFKNFKEIGAVSRSSRFLIDNLTHELHVDSTLSVIELGAGDGNTTIEILKRISNESSLTSVEINSIFINKLQTIKDKRLKLIHEDANSIASFKKNSIDFVISSLPIANFKNEYKDSLFLNILNIIKKDGFYIQYQYSLFDYKQLKMYFDVVKIKFTFFNIPPAFIYICKVKE